MPDANNSGPEYELGLPDNELPPARPMPVLPEGVSTALDILAPETPFKDRASTYKGIGGAPYWLVFGGKRYEFFVRYHAEYDVFEKGLDTYLPTVELRGYTKPPVHLNADDAVLMYHKDRSMTSRSVPFMVIGQPWEDTEGQHLSLVGYGSLMAQGPPWVPPPTESDA